MYELTPFARRVVVEAVALIIVIFAVAVLGILFYTLLLYAPMGVPQPLPASPYQSL